MCRWLAYSGNPIRLEALLLRTDHSLIDQSLHSRFGATTTNGDGFGVGWYDERSLPHTYRSIHPAWNDRNLREVAASVSSSMFLAHIRAATGTAVQETNCHPFRHGRWLFVHNGMVRDFLRVKRDLLLAIDPELVPVIEGSADSEILFHLALTFGLDEDPEGALERMVGFVEQVGERHAVKDPIQMTVAASDGERIVAARYSSEGKSRSLYFSTETNALKELYPEDERIQGLSDEARAIVSEPLGDLPGVWNEVPESSVGMVRPGTDQIRPFTPQAP